MLSLKDYYFPLTNGGGGGKVTTLKGVLDAGKSAEKIFYKYNGTSVDDLIKYDDTENVTNMRRMFDNCVNLTTIPLLDTSKVTNMGSIFYDCHKLKSIPLLDTSKVDNMGSMFFSCWDIETIPQIDMSKVTYCNGMFNNCFKLKYVPPFALLKTYSDIEDLFQACKVLENIEFLNVRSGLGFKRCFLNCYSLKKIVFHNLQGKIYYSETLNNCYHFTGTKNSSYNPEGLKDGYLYVPDEYVEQMRVATGWSEFATQIKGLSELPEEEQ